MSDSIKWIALLVMAAVLVVLGRGLINTMKGGDANTSQRLMRWRVILQFFAVCVLMLVLYVKSRT